MAVVSNHFPSQITLRTGNEKDDFYYGGRRRHAYDGEGKIEIPSIPIFGLNLYVRSYGNREPQS
jgi:hypothetical protein